jgi:hypothetical protein
MLNFSVNATSSWPYAEYASPRWLRITLGTTDSVGGPTALLRAVVAK